MIPIPGLATLRAIGIGLMLAGACSIVSGLVYYAKGHAAGKAEVQAILDRAIAESNAAAAAASESYRRDEAAWRASLDKAQTTYTEREAQHASEIASVRAAAAADVARLRRALSQPATGSPAPANPATPSDDCASTAGELLGESLQLQAELAAAAEREADAHRALRSAWPGVRP